MITQLTKMTSILSSASLSKKIARSPYLIPTLVRMAASDTQLNKSIEAVYARTNTLEQLGQKTAHYH